MSVNKYTDSEASISKDNLVCVEFEFKIIIECKIIVVFYYR